MVEPVDRSLHEDVENVARERVITQGSGRLANSPGGFITRFPDSGQRIRISLEAVSLPGHGQSRIVSTLNRETKNNGKPLTSKLAAQRYFRSYQS